MKELFDQVSFQSAKLITKSYSTSFSLGIRLLHRQLRKPIFNIYGFVRVADEIVDSFHEHDKSILLREFRNETHLALQRGISTNPVLNAFQETALKFNIGADLIDQFLHSMEMDLKHKEYSQSEYEEYIFGSAQVVGLMCLKVFLNGDEHFYKELKPYAMALGSAFQKVNFLRDMGADSLELGRRYFPQLVHEEFTPKVKKEIEADIEQDFKLALKGIIKLPKNARFGVYLSYVYYHSLFKKIKRTKAQEIEKKRIRIPNNKKFLMLFKGYLKNQMGIL